MKYSCIVVDDEPLARKIIVDYLSDIGFLECKGEFKSSLEAKTFLDDNSVDMVFLDINMPKLSGMELLRNFDINALIIFTTAYPEYAVEAFEHNSFDYLVKPISFERFLKAVERARVQLDQKTSKPTSGSTLMLKENKRLYKILQADILYVQAYGDYIKVICKNKTFVTKDKLRDLSKSFDNSIVQCHRSYFINVDQLEYIEGNHAMIEGEKIPISLSYKSALLEKMKAS